MVPCWLHTPPLRVHTHAAPRALLSSYPPKSARFPSADTTTENPCRAAPTAPVPTSLGPCCPNCASARGATIRRTNSSTAAARGPLVREPFGGHERTARGLFGASLMETDRGRGWQDFMGRLL